jgi:hypothetical protein
MDKEQKKLQESLQRLGLSEQAAREAAGGGGAEQLAELSETQLCEELKRRGVRDYIGAARRIVEARGNVPGVSGGPADLREGRSTSNKSTSGKDRSYSVRLTEPGEPGQVTKGKQ